MQEKSTCVDSSKKSKLGSNVLARSEYMNEFEPPTIKGTLLFNALTLCNKSLQEVDELKYNVDKSMESFDFPDPVGPIMRTTFCFGWLRWLAMFVAAAEVGAIRGSLLKKTSDNIFH
ncbi:hypothetical protein Leryth_021312 [Lithospermum erythrorhizon]|nr:hypothetical protein Leryth_021312 [Lithospermum erythrorhizon]